MTAVNRSPATTGGGLNRGTGGGTSEPACWWNHGQNSVLGDVHVFDEDCTANTAATQTGDGMIMEVHLDYKEGMTISTIKPQEFTDGGRSGIRLHDE